VSAEEHATRLLGMVAALEGCIIHFEERAPNETHEAVLRLRQLQDDILTAFLRHERDLRPL